MEIVSIFNGEKRISKIKPISDWMNVFDCYFVAV